METTKKPAEAFATRQTFSTLANTTLYGGGNPFAGVSVRDAYNPAFAVGSPTMQGFVSDLDSSVFQGAMSNPAFMELSDSGRASAPDHTMNRTFGGGQGHTTDRTGRGLNPAFSGGAGHTASHADGTVNLAFEGRTGCAFTPDPTVSREQQRRGFIPAFPGQQSAVFGGVTDAWPTMGFGGEGVSGTEARHNPPNPFAHQPQSRENAAYVASPFPA